MLGEDSSLIIHLASLSKTLTEARTYKNLSSKARVGLGLGIIAWGVGGLYLSDRAEEKYQAPADDKAVVERYVPRVDVVDKANEVK